MSSTPAYSNWHPRRLPERQDSYDSHKLFSSRPPTPLLFANDIAEREGPRGPHLARQDSEMSLLPLQLQGDTAASAPRRTLHQRARSISSRVPLPQGVSAFVAGASTVAFILSITTLVIGLHNKQMLTEATEARHDPHGPLASLIYTAVLHALQANLTAGQRPPPLDRILPDPA